jgi:hypothetical protein
MAESRDYLEMTFRSIECFSNDGKLDADELMSIANIALRDGQVDENEKRVLKNIVDRLNPAELSDELQEKISGLTKLFDL